MMKNWSIKKILKEIFSTVILVAVISWGINYLRQPESYKQLPQRSWKTVAHGTVFTIERQKPTIMHFWATWCPTCKLEAPNLEAIQNKVNLITIAVNSGSDQEIAQFMQERGYTYSVVNDREGKLAREFNVEAFPTTFIYDRNGTHRFSEVGYSTTLGLEARVAFINEN